MVKLFKSEKHVFWQALIAALIIFNFGIFLGYMLESSRVGKVSKLYAESELELLDIKIQSELFSLQNVNCSIAVEENIKFADKIYEEAKTLIEFEESARLTENIKLQHKKYDLLRTLFWVNSMKIKKQCNASYHNLVYFYKYNNPGIEEDAKQDVFSRMLQEVKEKYGGKIMLIPVAADNNITAVDMLVKTYNINILPTVLIDEKVKINELIGVEDIEKYLK